MQRYNAFIPVSCTIGQETVWAHEFNGIHIARDAQVGDRCAIYQHVTIGRSGEASPSIGNDVFIGAGAQIIGRCVVGDGAKIGAGVTIVDAIVEPGEVIINKSAYNLTTGRHVYPQD
jgi:serine acetyltransferase